MDKNNIWFTRSIIQDFVIFVAIVSMSAIFLISFDVSEKVYLFSRKHEDLELDEIILILAISIFYLSIFTIKRLIEINKILILANTDPLLGLTNRRKGSEYIMKEMNLVKEEQNTSSLIMIDIDDFKYINDTYGHEIGDYALLEISKIIQKTSRNSDVLVRWGGEEFIVVCPDTSLKQTFELAQRCRKNIEDYNFKDNIKITASFGVIELNSKEKFKSQLKKLDDKLYLSKEKGKNRVSY